MNCFEQDFVLIIYLGLFIPQGTMSTSFFLCTSNGLIVIKENLTINDKSNTKWIRFSRTPCIFKIYLRCMIYLLYIYLRYIWDSPQDIPEISIRYPKEMQKIYPRYMQDIIYIYLKFTSYRHWIYLLYTWDIPKIILKTIYEI